MNSVFIHNNIVIVTVAGDQNNASTSDAALKILQLSKKLIKLRILIDFTKLGKIDIGTRIACVKAAKDIECDKVAIYGVSNYITALFSLIMRSVGKRNLLSVALNKKEAESWLNM